MTNVEYDVYMNLESTDPKGITFLEFIDQLGKNGATSRELNSIYKLRRKYNIGIFTLEDCIMHNDFVCHKKHLWKLMTSAGITNWDDLVNIESPEDIRKVIPGLNIPQYMTLVSYYTKERSIRCMHVDPYWFYIYSKYLDEKMSRRKDAETSC